MYLSVNDIVLGELEQGGLSLLQEGEGGETADVASAGGCTKSASAVVGTTIHIIDSYPLI